MVHFLPLVAPVSLREGLGNRALPTIDHRAISFFLALRESALRVSFGDLFKRVSESI